MSTLAMSPTLMGIEILARLARTRATGVLAWSQEGVSGLELQLSFVGGRPESATLQAGPSRDRAQVVASLRGFAVLNSGSCGFTPQAIEVSSSLNIDTLGEAVVALMTALSPRQLAAALDARGGYEVKAGSSFERVMQAAVQVGGAKVAAPLAGAALASLVASNTPAAQRTWLVLLCLGGLEVVRKPKTDSLHRTQNFTKDKPITGKQAPPPPASEPPPPAAAPPPPAPVKALPQPPADPEARKLHDEIYAAASNLAQQTHYDLLGVPANADAEVIRKAYFATAKRWHSDRFAGAGLASETVEQAAEVFRRVEEAYRVLSNEAERKTYDYVLDRKARGLPTDPRVIMEAEGLFKKGQRLVRQGEAAAAEPFLANALALNRGEGEFWVYHGFALYSARGASAVEQARQEINTGLQMQPNLDAAHEFLGRIARLQGEQNVAMQHLRKAVEINPRNIDAARELRVLNMAGPAKAGKPSGESRLGGLLNKVLKR